MLLPPELNIKGKILKKDDRAIAIVGTRTPTDFGRDAAYLFSYELAHMGFTIVSGMARGIDTVVHKAALEAGGRTIAVLGSGIDVIYPPENEELYKKIIGQGAVVSEFPNGTKPMPQNFLARNQVIAYLSRAVLVIEGKRRSGTLSTARWAAEMGKEVYVLRGPRDSAMSEATNYLIEQGAEIVRSPQELANLV